MTPEELLELLADLARDGGLRVRKVGAARPGSADEPVPRSGICRLRDGIFVILVASESLEDRVEILAQALREHCTPLLEARYLPPAVRERLEATPLDRQGRPLIVCADEGNRTVRSRSDRNPPGRSEPGDRNDA